MRATFANPQLVNEMAVVDGQVKRGSLTRIEPEGKVVRMWEAIETYLNRRQPLIIVAGTDYGQGSSRDWAAKGVRLAGVETVVAEGFERIHRTNLIGMGVLPLEFKPGTTRQTLCLDGTETYDVTGDRTPRTDLTLVIHRRNGQTACPSPAGSIRPRKSQSMKRAACCNASRRIFWRPLHEPRRTNPHPRHLHARRHQQGRVLPLAGPSRALPDAGRSARCPAAARDRQPRWVQPLWPSAPRPPFRARW
jgi:hypothetical protein